MCEKAPRTVSVYLKRKRTDYEFYVCYPSFRCYFYLSSSQQSTISISTNTRFIFVASSFVASKTSVMSVNLIRLPEAKVVLHLQQSVFIFYENLF